MMSLAEGSPPSARTLCRGAHSIRNGKRLIGAVEEFDGHEDHLLVAEIFQVMDLELARSIGLVPGLARLIGIFDGGAVMDMLTAAAAADRGPEIIEHMAMKADPLAGREADDPDPYPLTFRN